MATSVSSLSSNFFPSAQNGFTTTLASTISSGATTVPLNSVAGYTNGEVATFIVDPSDATKKQTFTGVIDTGGVQVTSVVWTAGTNQSHTSGATVVDYATATHISQISKGILTHADQDGTLKAGAVDVAGVLANGVVSADKLASDAVTTAKILNSNVTTAKIADNAITGPLMATSAIKLGYAEITSGVGPIACSTSDKDVAGLSVTVTVPAGGRDILIIAKGGGYEQTGGIGTVYAVMRVLESTTQIGGSAVVPSIADIPFGWNVTCRVSAPSAGSHTYKVAVDHNGTGPNYTIGAASTDPSFILVMAI